jgi:exodeoxyribonuclease V alpha subunit
MTAVRNSICIISGGPGSGKTYTIARIILILKALAGPKALQIALAAPTGKAAARLHDAVSQGLASLQTDPLSKNDQSPKAATLHRLLGYRPATGGFHYHADHPLPVDGVIVDEASMVDLGLMARLVAALPSRARLILVGDKDQLSSVEAGAVLGDICYGISNVRPSAATASLDDGPGAGPPALQDRILVLTRNYRFDSQSGIAALCRAINQGDAKQCLSLLNNSDYPDISLRPIAGWRKLKSNLTRETISRIRPLFQMPSTAHALAGLNRFRFLAAVRKGPFGVESINALIEEELKRRALIPRSAGLWYPFRPLMITSNDYVNELFNGDLGMVEGGDAPGQMTKIVFEDGKGGYRRLAPHQLPPHETVFAMTIHKSQGSEFDRVVVVLPDRDVPVLTRELVYTAVTRARKSVTIWGDADLLARAVRRHVYRASGLREALWG